MYAFGSVLSSFGADAMRPDVTGMLIDGKGDAPAGPFALCSPAIAQIAGGADDGVSSGINRLAPPFIRPDKPNERAPEWASAENSIHEYVTKKRAMTMPTPISAAYHRSVPASLANAYIADTY
jgi:hypothetical protein